MGARQVTAFVVACRSTCESSPAPGGGLLRLLPTTSCTWRTLPPRLALTAAPRKSSASRPPYASCSCPGLLSSILRYSFFAGVTLIAYLCHGHERSTGALSLSYPIFTASTCAVRPARTADRVGESSVAYANRSIGTANLVLTLFAAPTTRQPRCASALAAASARARARLER